MPDRSSIRYLNTGDATCRQALTRPPGPSLTVKLPTLSALCLTSQFWHIFEHLIIETGDALVGMQNVPITVAYGDGIGPEIMNATLHILKEAGARLDIETIDIGERVFLAGYSSGIEPKAWDSLRRPKVI